MQNKLAYCSHEDESTNKWKFYETRSLKATQDSFQEKFRDWESLTKKTIWYNIRMYDNHGISLNRNNIGQSGRKRTAVSAENVDAVKQQLQEHSREISARRNGVVEFSKKIKSNHSLLLVFSSFSKAGSTWNPFWEPVRTATVLAMVHGAMQQKPSFPTLFPHWLWSWFALNGKVNTPNVLEYGPVGEPPNFNFHRSSTREKVTVWIGIVVNGVRVLLVVANVEWPLDHLTTLPAIFLLQGYLMNRV